MILQGLKQPCMAILPTHDQFVECLHLISKEPALLDPDSSTYPHGCIQDDNNLSGGAVTVLFRVLKSNAGSFIKAKV